MSDVSPQSPEERGRRRAAGSAEDDDEAGSRWAYPWLILKRVFVGVFSDGFIHAGNLAYLSLLTLFPFFIVAAAIGHLFGRNADSARAVASFLHTLPPNVSDLLRKPIADVLTARTGSLLWLGGLVGLWTVGSFVETIRDIVRRAYGVGANNPFWHYRLSSVAIIIGSVVLAMIAFVLQGIIVAAEQIVYRLLPELAELGPLLGLSRLVPGLVLLGALYMLFYSVTPSKYRYAKCPKWPGALLVASWWVGITALLPAVLSRLGNYDLTYGSLAGVVIMLFFFWLIGFGIVIGAHLNAALAETDRPAVSEAPSEA